MTDFADLVVARSYVTIRTDMYTDMAGLGVDVEGVQASRLLRAFPELFSRLEAAGEDARVKLAMGGYPSLAVQLTDAPGWMYLNAIDFYQITPDAAIATLGKVRVTATSTASGSTIQPGDFIIAYGSGPTARLYQNTEGFTPVLGSYVEVPMVAQVAGVAGNVGNGVTWRLVTAYPGLTVTNPPLSGATSWITRRGKDAEALTSIKDRCDAQWANLAFDVPAERFARIIRDAFEASDLTNPITRIYVDDANPDGPGSVWVYMARDSLPAEAEDVALVDAYVIPRWRAGGGPFASKAAAVLTITIDGTIKGPADETAALTQLSAALDALAPTYAIGGDSVFKEQVESAAFTGVSGAKNVVFDLPEETTIPAGSIVEFAVGDVTVVP